MENKDCFLYTDEQLMSRLKFFIGVCLALTLTGIVFVVLYSLIFVTQPLNAISPIDQKFFELIIPIATFLTGTLSGIMLAGGDKDAQKMALEAATRQTPVSPAPSTPPSSGGFGSTLTTSGFGQSSGFGTPPATSGFGTTPAPAAGGFGQSLGFGAAAATGGFGTGSNLGFGAPATGGFGTPATTGQVVTGFGGKPAPVQPPDPIL